MSQTESKPAGMPYPVKLILGLALAIGGTWLSVENKIPGRDALAAKGIQLDVGMTIATIGVFLILFPLMDSFFLTPLREAIQERNTNLENTFAEAENLRTEMQKMRTEYDRRLAETEAEARAHIQTQIREAQQLRATLMEEATRKTDALIAQAEQEIAAERDRLISDLRGHVVDLALAAAEKVIGENMDSDKNRRMVDEFITRVEAVH
jgi:F-type H+-transporting ATPase subunit b